MIKPKQVPKEAVEAARKFMRLQALSDEWIDDLLAAALNAWPGMHKSMKPRMVKPGEFEPMDYIALPLPPDDTNE